MKIKPFKDYVLLKERPIDAISKAGILLPTGRDEENHLAFIEEVGPSSELKIGALVLVKRYMFDEIQVEGEKYLMGKQEGIVAHVLD